MSITEAEIKNQSELKEDMTDLPYGFENIYVKSSIIEGKGLYSVTPINTGDLICLARIGNKRTLGGRYTNHALQANAKMVMNKHDIELIALIDIPADEEITVNYSDVLNMRDSKGDLCQE